jgi:trimeric autotransporter adhesin
MQLPERQVRLSSRSPKREIHMSLRNLRGLIALASISALADSSVAQICVTSGAGYNTACGSYSLLSNTSGGFNTAVGFGTLQDNSTGGDNTAVGYASLNGNSTGVDNTAVGGSALTFNSMGSYNSAFGSNALRFNTTGTSNTAVGFLALTSNATGSANTAVGEGALNSNSRGLDNSAFGYDALASNTSGTDDDAQGYQALYSNVTGVGNNAFGYQSLYDNTTGSYNTAIGNGALYSSTTGYGNDAIGLMSLENMTAGNRNTAVGNNAGLNLVSGSYNTYIGWYASGGESEDYVTRIGVTYVDPKVPGAPTTFVSGIWGTSVTGSAVMVNSKGQLGVVVSSERFKTDIVSLGTTSKNLSLLRPVSFHLKSDPNGAVQYGLIAEEVDKVYPELVLRDSDGKIQGVRYDELAPMLLNEVQKQQRINSEQADQNAAQSAKIASLEKQLADIQVALVKLQSSDKLVAQR